jgi:hypothetical protein
MLLLDWKLTATSVAPDARRMVDGWRCLSLRQADALPTFS